MTYPAEIIPTVGAIQQASRQELSRSTADHFALIRGVLRRHLARASLEHQAQLGSFAAVEECEAALASLRHIESEGKSTN